MSCGDTPPTCTSDLNGIFGGSCEIARDRAGSCWIVLDRAGSCAGRRRDRASRGSGACVSRSSYLASVAPPPAQIQLSDIARAERSFFHRRSRP
eukprot:5474662-Prymnesium_polylepis.1